MPEQAKSNSTSTTEVSTDIDNFLKQVAPSWRHAMKHHNRIFADKLLQISLKAIPPRSGTWVFVLDAVPSPPDPNHTYVYAHTHVLLSGRVAEWIGPKYFDQMTEITAGCPVRVMRADDNANFRNGYESSNMGESLIYTFVFFTSFLTIVLHIMYSNRGSKARGFWKC